MQVGWLAAVGALTAIALPGAGSTFESAPTGMKGLASHPAREAARSVPATFLRDSYRPGSIATLVLWQRERSFTVQVFRAGSHRLARSTNTTMRGVPVSPLVRFGPTAAHTPVRIPIGQWRSGLYFAQVKARGRAGFAPFVVRPSTLERSSVLVVLPTYTWQAYNHRDDDADGRKNTWYAGTTETVRLDRPYLARGVPPHFRLYDLPFLNWLSRTGKSPDFFSDTDLDAARDARSLARAYRLIVFPGHHEYVTEREYDLIERYRDLGGHLMFLSANNFYYEVVRTGAAIRRGERWRDQGRPEAALLGVQYIRGDGGTHKDSWIVRSVSRHPWIFADTGLEVGSSFGRGGIEIDHTAPSSPRKATVLAEIPDVMGRGHTAQMTYYETPAGGRVFAAGAFTLGGTRDALVYRLLENLWHGLSGDSEDPNRLQTAR